MQGPGKSWNFLGYEWEVDTMMQVQICGFLCTRKIEKAFSFRGFGPPDLHCEGFGQIVCHFKQIVHKLVIV